VSQPIGRCDRESEFRSIWASDQQDGVSWSLATSESAQGHTRFDRERRPDLVGRASQQLAVVLGIAQDQHQAVGNVPVTAFESQAPQQRLRVTNMRLSFDSGSPPAAGDYSIPRAEVGATAQGARNDRHFGRSISRQTETTSWRPRCFPISIGPKRTGIAAASRLPLIPRLTKENGPRSRGLRAGPVGASRPGAGNAVAEPGYAPWLRPMTWPSGSATIASQVSGAGLNLGMTTWPPRSMAFASVASRSETET
jgi:hypothetical protein